MRIIYIYIHIDRRMVQTTIQRATRMVDGILNGSMRINCDQQNYVISCYFVPPTHMLQMTNPHGMVSQVCRSMQTWHVALGILNQGEVKEPSQFIDANSHNITGSSIVRKILVVSRLQSCSGFYQQLLADVGSIFVDAMFSNIIHLTSIPSHFTSWFIKISIISHNPQQTMEVLQSHKKPSTIISQW